MKCPFCNAQDTKVLESRLMNDGLAVRRRRKCESCLKRFNTFEKIEISMPQVVKNDGRRENFDRKKILNGIQKSCQKRPISVEQIDRVVENIEKNILEISDKEIHSKKIGELVMSYLQNLDPVAYVRFASVYKTFHDVDEFLQDLKQNNSASTDKVRN
jgi:transcriptional repressor NrdR